MKIKVNKRIIKKLKPCKNRFDNYLQHYSDFNGDINKFLDLPNITHSDKLWVTLRLMPRHLVEVFAIDMSFASIKYISNINNIYTSYAADYAAGSADITVTALDAAYYAASAAAHTSDYACLAAYFNNKDNDIINYVAMRKLEQDNQILVLKYLIESE